MKTRRAKITLFMTLVIAGLSLSMIVSGLAEEKKVSSPMLVSEANQPKGFPAPGVVGKVIVKT